MLPKIVLWMWVILLKVKKKGKKISGLVRESNPGPLAPKARIMPLDQPASVVLILFNEVFVINTDACVCSAWLQARHNINVLLWPMNVICTEKILVHVHK